MSKLQTLLLQILGCVVFGIVLGTAFWLFDGGKTREKASDCPGGVSIESRWIESMGTSTVYGYWEIKKPAKVYKGKWYRYIWR